MLLGAAFVISVGVAMLVFRRARWRMRWLIATVVLFERVRAYDERHR